ncbi:non-functional pseudokinase ZRK2 [Citrus sinensis]|uniref:somatic embryogenesis receptor kinase 1-like isoform X2 n=1 Tax=Citrus sinensis TaxID=2711 RepID=UPI0021A09ACA|nr:somatic embryogenesis receptor kinase 1-like isoform X2 [Citrus sinensis]KAH9689315.1 non-functional pseudokinase ZRK2 [Citrus sinensis]
MSSILRKFKLREQTQSTDKATFVIRNGESVLKELIRASNGETHVSDALRGTLPIFAPEYLTGNFNEKADVFSFGVFLGELLTGLRAFDLARLNEDDGYVALRDHVKKYFEEDRLNEIIDPLIMGDRSCSGKEQQLQAYAHLIFECVNESPVDRPTMVDVAKKLKQMYRSCA